jgi:DNA-binding response OmpR family regulator
MFAGTDSRKVRQTCEAYFGAGYEMLHVKTSSALMQALLDEACQVVIIDENIDDDLGLSCVRGLRILGIPEPIVLLTSGVLIGDVLGPRWDPRTVALVQKPFTREHLAQVVSQIGAAGMTAPVGAAPTPST